MIVDFSAIDSYCSSLAVKDGAQGAGRPFDLPKKLPMSETRVFGFGTTWGAMFTKVILLRMAEAVLYF